MAQWKVQRTLEREGGKQPPESRMRRTGWFRKPQEETDERERFIRDYVDDKFEERLKQEFGIEDK